MRAGAVVVATVVLVLAGAAWPHASLAGPGQESLLQDDDQLLHLGPERADATLDELRALGVDRIRLSVIWRNIAPRERPSGDLGDPRSYPAAQFDPIDHVVRGAHARGIGVLLNVRGDAPDWALGRRPPKKLRGYKAFRPDAAAFGRFAAMLGRRYDGNYADENQGGGKLPRVGAWSIWNEPNWGGHLQPQSVRVRPKGRRSYLKTVAPKLYRDLYRAAAVGLQETGHGGDILLIGETSPVGVAKLGHLANLRPMRFLRDLFCLDARNRPLRGRRARRVGCDFDRHGALPATGYAHHPYPVDQPPDRPSANRQWIKLADSARLEALLDSAAAAGRIRAGLPLWYTEFGYETSPPDPRRGIPLDTHAAWLAQAERITWANPRVAALTQFLLRDDEPRTQFSDVRRRWQTYQTGLRFEDGRPKPAYETYRIPLVAQGRELWGLVRPAQNGRDLRLRVEHRAREGEEWQTVGERVVSDPRGYFTETLPAGRAGQYRVVWVRSRAADGGLLGGLGDPPAPEETASQPVNARP